MFLGLPDPHPDPLDRGMDPRIQIRIRIRTNMSRIPNIDYMASCFSMFHTSSRGEIVLDLTCLRNFYLCDVILDAGEQ
jgi:hypothetical protein